MSVKSYSPLAAKNGRPLVAQLSVRWRMSSGAERAAIGPSPNETTDGEPPNGFRLARDRGRVLSMALETASGRVLSEPIILAEGVSSQVRGALSTSPGVLTYRMGPPELRLLVWMTRTSDTKSSRSRARDGRYILYSTQDPTSGYDVWARPTGGGRSSRSSKRR